MDSTALALITPPVANTDQYLRAIERFPVLDEADERELVYRFRRDNDLDAAWKLVTSHLRDVFRIARRYKGYGLPQEDLIQEGNIGLMHAVRRFDPAFGVRLMAYAAYWIRAQIHSYIQKNWRIVRLGTSKAKRKLFYKLRSAKRRLAWLTNNEAAEVAENLGVRQADVLDMEAMLYGPDLPYDTPLYDNGSVISEKLPGSAPDPESLVEEAEYYTAASTALNDALGTLDERSRDIVQQRWLSENRRSTLTELGERFGISAERVRQIESAALKKMRAQLVRKLGSRSAAEFPRTVNALG